MKIGDRVYTPRFCNVVIKEIFNNKKEAKEAGYTEPTYLFQDGYGVAGKTLDEYHMEFCAFKEERKNKMDNCFLEDVDICPHCDTENIFEVSEENPTYIGRCKSCGRQMFLCDLCLHGEDNPEQKCDWHLEGDESVCFRGRYKEA